MLSNSLASLAISKAGSVPSQNSSPSQSQAPQSFGTEGHSQRRSGGSGSFGAGANTRSTTSAARNNQTLRKAHKGQKRHRFADEDTAAESVRQ